MKSPLQLVMGMHQAHRNHYLFSDHYLNNLLPQDPRWEKGLPETKATFSWLQRLYAEEQNQLPGYNESQLEDHWFKPILEQLGHVYEGQASVPGLDRQVKRPDFAFFPDNAARQAAVKAQKTTDYAANALAVGEVKAWDVPMGKKEKGGGPAFEAQNPSWQIDYYVRTTGLTWGVLSNGRLWRLVHKDSSQRLSIYYELDLVELLRRGKADELRYFTMFFRQAAFLPDARGGVFLDDALKASSEYAVELEEDLKENTYQALERLIQGFLDLPANHLGESNLREIYDNSLYLLYRVLFILYAESRGLLPLETDQYREQYSMRDIQADIARGDAPTAPTSTVFWNRLQTLFHIINGDDAELNRYLGVPRYNGGLFSPNLHPFLEEKAVGDQALTQAIDLLCRRTTEAGREFVDYRTLGVRHLGSIYEGLLEYQPRYAREPMVAVRDRKGERWMTKTSLEESPLGSGKTPRIKTIARRESGQVYLETDRGERKATGSYYTPQYIVEYIVSNTLGPLVEEAVERVRVRARAAKGKTARNSAEQSLANEILNLKVLDPAMGSGHFLVEATEFLALELATDPYVEVGATPEEDLSYWRRRVVERCIYGVDKNPLSVELAKLSLWLATVAVDKPLSFLDHHLKCGDSLIGARVADLGWVPSVLLSKKGQKEMEQQKAGQINMFEYLLSQKLPTVMSGILEITEVESDSYDTVQAKEAADQAVRRLKAPFQAVADLWISAYFSSEVTRADYEEALGLVGRPQELLSLLSVQWAHKMAQERRFFHWELAFPEVFYDRHGQPLRERAGFDAVVGNPPYDVLAEKERTDDLKPLMAYLEDQPDVQAALGRKLDLYRLFTAKALSLAKKRAGVGLIVPMSLLADLQTLPLRRYILEHHRFVRIDAFPQKDDPDRRVFLEAKLPTAIVLIQREPATVEPTQVFVHPGRLLEEVSGSYSATAEDIAAFSEDRLQIPLAASQRAFELAIRLACGDAFGPMGKRVDTHQGEINETTMGELLGQDPSIGPKVLRGGNVQRYHFLEEAKQGTTKFLDVEGYERTVGGKRVDHARLYRIGYQRNSALDNWRRLIFAPLSTPSYCYDSVSYYTVGENKTWGHFLLALFNSHLLNWRFSLTSTNNHVSTGEIVALPLRRIEFSTPADERAWLEKKGRQLYEGYIHSGGEEPVITFVENQLRQEPERSDVVHDLLAYLAERMIAMHQEKQATTEAFWLDLEGVSDEEVFGTLRKKGKQKATLWKRAEACRPFVKEESHSTRRLDESLGWNEDAFKAFVKLLVRKVAGLNNLVEVYRQYHPGYRELVARIAATDRLIDQVVYKLYGLTAEEIAIVEGL